MSPILRQPRNEQRATNLAAKSSSTSEQHPLRDLLRRRIAIIDGAMGTTIRTYGMKEADVRGQRFKDAPKDLLNNGDIFSLTQPEMICDIHRRFLEAGADIILPTPSAPPASRRASSSSTIPASTAGGRIRPSIKRSSRRRS